MWNKISLLSALFLSATCIPLEDIKAAGYGEIQVLERDAPLHKRDVEHAELHGVNLTEMFRHSIIKRDNDDHVVVYVDRSFESVEGPRSDPLPRSMQKREIKLTDEVRFVSTWRKSDRCSKHTRTANVTVNSPFAEDLFKLYHWAENTYGVFRFSRQTGYNWKNLILAGTLSRRQPTTYRAYIKDPTQWEAGIGTTDVRDDVQWTYVERQKIGNDLRAESYGQQRCRLSAGPACTLGYQIKAYNGTF